MSHGRGRTHGVVAGARRRQTQDGQWGCGDPLLSSPQTRPPEKDEPREFDIWPEVFVSS